ncbi:MAG TPA: hypothetical protein VIB11_04805 [Pedococcus sp.]|uniref:hypothetical protein n=1 Tax=Pedococcus sp. TaxID=2860345 RepID=UPI002F958E80
MVRDALLRSQLEQWELIRDYMASYARHVPVRTVAVVGNAPLAPDARRAEAIDACDLVIRANAMMLDAPGEPPCVGTACHAVVLSRATAVTPWVFKDYRNRAYLVPQAGFVQYHLENKVGLLLRTDFWPEDLGAMPLPNAVVKARVARALDPEHRPGSLIPTTGMMAMFMAHEMFPSADLLVTGFSFLEDCEQTHWSHHSGGRTKVNWQHRLDLEAALLRSWIDDGSARYLP